MSATRNKCVEKSTTFWIFLLRNVNATLNTYVLVAHSRMNIRSIPFNRCSSTIEGKANNTYPTYASNPKAHILVKLKLQKESENNNTCVMVT